MENQFVIVISLLLILVSLCINSSDSQQLANGRKLTTVFSWKQIIYSFNGVEYTPSRIQNETDPNEFFIAYNNVPVGMEVYKDRLFVTVPRRRYGIPSTLNFVKLSSQTPSPALQPYPDVESAQNLYSVYRPRVDACDRLWVVDTGLLEMPNARRQVNPPSIVIFDLITDTEILRYNLKSSDLVTNRTAGGLNSITVDVDKSECDAAFAYVTDLATNGIIVFSLKDNDSWRFDHGSFAHEPSALNYVVGGHTITWRDGIFSIALSGTNEDGYKTAFYHPIVSKREYSIDTRVLRNRNSSFDRNFKVLGTRGPLSQSGSHGYHAPTSTVLFANVARDAIACWNVNDPLSQVGVVAQDHRRLVYISDLKVIGDDVWVLVNQMPIFAFGRLNVNDYNFFVHRSKVRDLIRGTACDI